VFCLLQSVDEHELACLRFPLEARMWAVAAAAVVVVAHFFIGREEDFLRALPVRHRCYVWHAAMVVAERWFGFCAFMHEVF
jgi:hypothetical protein